MTGETIKAVSDRYGPYAFGVVVIIIMYTAMFKPLLDRQLLDFENQRTIIEAQSKLVDSQQAMLKDQDRLSENLKQTSTILERVIDKMETKDALAP